jgi:hypothetical protein
MLCPCVQDALLQLSSDGKVQLLMAGHLGALRARYRQNQHDDQQEEQLVQ